MGAASRAGGPMRAFPHRGPVLPRCPAGPLRSAAGRARSGTARALALALLAAGGCGPAAPPADCGNGRLDPGEACDDGNRADGDCCSSSCQLLPCPAAQAPALSWEEIGPRSLGGRVSSLAVDPRDRATILAGTPAGGIWRSRDGGTTWAPVAPWLALSPISALAIHPADGNVAIAGTGSLDDGGEIRAGIGILRTTDGGLTWDLAPSTAPPYVAALLVWEQEPDRVLAATGIGVLLSEDGGATFAEVLHADGVSALERDPFDANGIFAACRAGLYRSPDRGRTWEPVSTWPLLATDVNGAGTVALAASRRTPGLLYATVQVLASFFSTDRALLLRSADGGVTFAPVATAPAFCPGPATCGFAHALWLDPLDDGRLLLGGDRLYASDDAGATWRDLGPEAHGVHAIAADAQGGTVAGAFGVGALDAARTAVALRNDGLAVARVVDLDVSGGAAPRLLAATRDSGTALGSGAVPAWSVVFGEGEEAGPARFDPLAADRLYVSRPGGLLFRSDDAGATFSSIVSGLDMTEPAATRAPMEPSALVPGTAYAGRARVYQSTDAGNTWAPYRPAGSPEVACIAPSPLRAERVYFSLAWGPDIYKADGTTTDVLTTSSDAKQRIKSIFLDPRAENAIFAAGTTSAGKGLVLKSDDFGASWSDATPAGMPAATSVVKDRFGALYVGTARGVMRSANDGFTWSRFDDGLLAVGVTALRVADDVLYAGTAGRGVFRVRLRPLATVDTIPPGGRLVVDGQVVTAPLLEPWPPGTTHTVAPYLLQTEDMRQEFLSWSDGGAAAHAVVDPGGNFSLTAAIQTSYRLRFGVAPAAGGSLLPEPVTPDSFYVEGTLVRAIASPVDDYRFTGWDGDVSTSLDLMALAVMDRPRSITARFEPLRIAVKSSPPGLALQVDGATVTAPATYQWKVDSVHALSAPEVVDLDPADPPVLAFERWSDLLPREQSFTVRRDTFVTDLTAEYITTVPSIDVPAAGARLLRTPGQAEAARVVSLHVGGGAAAPPEAAAILDGEMGGVRTVEAVLVPTRPALQVDAFVEGGAGRGQTRLAVANPGTLAASVTLALRDATGAVVVGVPAAFDVPPGTTFVAPLEQVMLLSPVFEGLLSVLSDTPVAVSIQSVRSNLRPSTFLDPVLLVPFTAADRNVPADPLVQALMRTAGTEHRLVLFNAGFAPLSGTLAAFDETGAPLPFTAGGSASASYALPPWGWAAFRFTLPAAPAGGSALATGFMVLVPDAGQPFPRPQLVEEVAGTDPPPTGPAPVLPRAIPPSRPATRFLAPVDAARRDSGVVVWNPGAAPAAATLTLLGLAGDTVQTATRTIPAQGQAAFLASEVFPGAGQAQGVMRVETVDPVWGVGILRSVNARGEEILAGFPAFAGEQADPALELPWVADGDSWSAHLWLLGTAQPSHADLPTRHPDGTPLRLPMVWP